MTEARIVVIPKLGKDVTHCESYSPIFSLQVDINIVAIVLVHRVHWVILSIIHPDQSGFMPSKSSAQNPGLLPNIQSLHDKCGSRVFWDVLKAFDSVEWKYLLASLPEFIRWVCLVYCHPVATVMAFPPVPSFWSVVPDKDVSPLLSLGPWSKI